MTDALDPATLQAAQAGFVEALPHIEHVLSFRLRGLRGDRKEEAMEEGRALAWANYLQLVRDGRDPEPLLNKIAEFASRSVRSGHRLTGYDALNDAMSPRARHRYGHSVQSLSPPEDEEKHPGPVAALRDYREPDPADEAQARIDHEARRAKLTEEQREIADDLVSGMNTADVGRKRGVSRTRIWQHREEMKAALQESGAVR